MKFLLALAGGVAAYFGYDAFIKDYWLGDETLSGLISSEIVIASIVVVVGLIAGYLVANILSGTFRVVFILLLFMASIGFFFWPQIAESLNLRESNYPYTMTLDTNTESFEAEIVGRTTEIVKFKRNGRETTLPIEDLKPLDQKKVRSYPVYPTNY